MTSGRAGSGKIIYVPVIPTDHECDPPRGRGEGLSIKPLAPEGSIWQCDCGDYHVVQARHWKSISPRRARRLMRRVGIEC